MRKRLLASLLSLAMLLTMLPVTAFAAEQGDSNGGDTGTADETTTLSGTGDPTDPYIITAADIQSGVYKFTQKGNYQLSGNETDPIEMTVFWCQSGGVGGGVTLDLNGHSITQKTTTDTAGYPLFWCDKDMPSLTLTNSAEKDSVLTVAEGGCLFQVDEQVTDLTIGERITLQSNGEASYGIFVTNWESVPEQSPQITLNGCKFTGTQSGDTYSGNGITVNGNSKANPKFTLDGVTMENISFGIYQAGVADTTDGSDTVMSTSITNSSIDAASVGIEIRAGKLTLTNSTVTGGNGTYSVSKNSSGSTTENAALAIAKHVTGKDIEVNLSGDVSLTGTVALSVANPQNISGNVTVNIAGGTYTAIGEQSEKAAINVDAGTGDNIGTTTVNVTGGTFSDNPTEWVNTNTHVVVENTDKSDYTVKTAVTGPVKVSLNTTGLTTADTPPTASITSPETGVEAETKWYKLNGDTLDETSAVESFEEGTYKAVVTVTAVQDYIFTENTKFQLNNAAETSPTEAIDTFPLTSDTVTVEKPKYAVTIDTPEGGTVTASIPDGSSTKNLNTGDTVAVGTIVTVTATPTSAETHVLDKITVVPTDSSSSESGPEVSEDGTFTMPAYPVTISAEFTAKQQETPVVTVAIDKSAAITLEESTTETSVEDATNATVTLATSAGYTMKVTTSGAAGNVTEGDNGTEVKLGTGPNVINITLTKTGADTITYTVTINNTKTGGDEEKPVVRIIIDDGDPKLLNEGDNGTIDVTNGETVIVSVQDPAELADGYDVGIVNANSEGSVNLDEQTVTLGKGANAITITLSNGSNTLTYTVTINNTVGEDPNPPVGDDGYTITNDTAADANGTLTVAESAKAGDEVTVTVTPDDGYEVDTISVTYTEDGTNVEYEETADGFKFVMPAADVTIKVTFKQIPQQQNVSLLVKAGEKELLKEVDLDDTKTYVINVDHEVTEVTFTTNAVITKGEETISGEAVTLDEGVNEYTLTAGDKTFKLTIVRAKGTQTEENNVSASDVTTVPTTADDGTVKIEATVSETATLEQIANTSKGGTVSIPATKSDTTGDVTSSTVSLPQTVTESMKDKDVNVEIATNVGTVTIPSEAVVQALTDENENVTSAELKLVVENAANPDATAKATFEVSIKKITKDEDGETIKEETTNIEQLSKPIILIFAFDNDGIKLHQPTLAHVVNTGSKFAYRSIKNSFYNAEKKIITGETDHLSEFAVVDLYQLEDFGEQKLTLRRDPNENWPGAVKVVVTNAVNIGSDPVYIVQYKDPVKAMYVYTVVRPEADGTVSFIAMNNSEVCVWEALDGALNADGTPNLSGRTNDIKIDSSEPMGFKGEVVTKSMATVE